MTASKTALSSPPYGTNLDSLNAETLKRVISHHIITIQGREPERVGYRDLFKALAYTLRDTLIEKWIKTQKNYYAQKRKRVYYLSMEFLIGRSLGNTLINLGYYDKIAQVVKELGYDLDEVREEEEDAALGNGGLGRLPPV